MSRTLSVRIGTSGLAAGFALIVTVGGAVWLWQPWQSSALATSQGADVDPAPRALVEAVQPPRQDADSEHALVQLALRAPQEAWEAAIALPESPWSEHLRRFVAALWVEQEPRRALTAFEAMDEARMPTNWMFEMLARWMTVDEEAAAEWALATGAGRPRVLMAGAIDWLLDHGEPRDATLAAAERLLRRWAQRTPDAAWEVASTKWLSERSVLLHAVAEVWFERDPHTTLSATLSSEIRVMSHPWVADLAARWVRTAPRQAAKWALALPSAAPDKRLLTAAVHAWLSVFAMDEAKALTRELGDAEAVRMYHSHTYGQQLRKLLKDDPRKLAEWLDRQPDERLRTSQTRMIAHLYRETHPDEALEWALGLPTKESGSALRAIIPAIAEDDPRRAEHIVQSMADPSAQIGVAAAFLGDWAERRGQPAQAHEWSVENLTPSVRRATNRGLFMDWGLQKPAGAASASHAIADREERLAAQLGAYVGMVMGIDSDETPEQLHQRMLAIDGVFDSLLEAAAVEGKRNDASGSDFGDALRQKLYEYWKETDPERAAKYKELPERHDESAQ